MNTKYIFLMISQHHRVCVYVPVCVRACICGEADIRRRERKRQRERGGRGRKLFPFSYSM